MPSGSCGFCDLNISENFDLRKLDIVKKLGYDVVVVDRFVDESSFERKKRKKEEKNEPGGKTSDPIPEPVKLVEERPSGVTVLRRLTVEFSDPSIAHGLSRSENSRKYDLLAVIPTSASAFQHACLSMDVDLISFRADTDYKINRKLYRRAVERGVHFELTYASALKSTVSRKNLIARTRLYRSIGKSTNIVLSSGAQNEFQIRGPYDVKNLCLLLGLDERQSEKVLTENARKALLKADGRRRGKVSIHILKKSETSKRPSPSEDVMKVKKLKISH